MSLHTIRISVSKDSSPNHHISIITLSHLWDRWSQLQIHVFRKHKLVRASHNTRHAKYYKYYVLLCLQWKTPDDAQRNCPKHVEFYSKNKFKKLVYLVGLIIRIYYDARSPERQIVQIHPISLADLPIR
jgi:hypothetical protein